MTAGRWRAAAPLSLLALLAAIIMGAGGSASAQILFLPATAAEVAAARASAPLAGPTVRQRLVRVDPDVLARHVAPETASDAAGLAQARRLDGIVRVDLFPDTVATFRRSDVSASRTGGYVWAGVANQPFHEALLLIDGGRVSGRVQLDSRLFRIDHVAGRLHRITELAPHRFPPEAPPNLRGAQPERDAPRGRAAQPEAVPRANAIITVLVAYTKAAEAEAGSAANMLATIDLAVALTNQAYMRGGVPVELQLAGAPVKVDYDERGNIFGNLFTLSDGDEFQSLRSLRRSRKADLVSLLRKADKKYCGVAYLPGSGQMPKPGSSTRGTGYSVVVHSCVPNLTFHHELGHNMGLHHDRFVAPNADSSVYNFGYVNKTRRVRTVMAYPDACRVKGFECARVNWYSSSTVRAQPGNIAIGKPKGTSGAADNTRRLIETTPAVSRYFN